MLRSSPNVNHTFLDVQLQKELQTSQGRNPLGGFYLTGDFCRISRMLKHSAVSRCDGKNGVACASFSVFLYFIIELCYIYDVGNEGYFNLTG